MSFPRVALAAIAVTALLAGCSGPGSMLPPTQPSSSAPSEAASENAASAQPASTPMTEEEKEESGATKAGIDSSNPPPAIATITTPGPGGDKLEKITHELIDVKRRGKLLYVMFRLTPEGTYEGTHSLFSYMGDSTWTPFMIDPDNLKKYSGVSEITSADISVRTSAGKPMYIMTAFGYPEGASTVDIGWTSTSHAVLFEGVKVP